MKSSILILLIVDVICVAAEFQLQLLHNNDMHARLEEIDQNLQTCTEESIQKKLCFGGLARVKEAANHAAQEARIQNTPSIFLNAGDSFQGTPYYSLKKWKIMAPLVDSIGFDVMCLGNHEFDNGIDNLVNYLTHVTTPVVVCNLNITTEARLNLPNLKPATILTVNNKRIGVVGYLTPDTMTGSSTENLQILDEIPSLRAEARRLKQQGIKIIIALGHSGFERDKQIAEQVEEISLIVGGHSHTFLYTPKDYSLSTEKAVETYPYFITQKSGKKIPIVHAFAFTKYLGKLSVTFDDDGNVISAEGNPELLDWSFTKEPQVNSLVESWTTPLKAKLEEIVGYTRVPLLKPNFTANQYESTAANVITDAFIYFGVCKAKECNVTEWTNAPISFYNAGGIRNELRKGAILLKDLLMVVPFENLMYEVRLRGLHIKNILEQISAKEQNMRESKSFLYFSGLNVTINMSQPVGSRIVSITALCTNCTVPYMQPLNLERVYTVITDSYLTHVFQMLIKDDLIDAKPFSETNTDVLLRYVKKIEIIYPKYDGRISVEFSTPTSTWSTHASKYSALPPVVLIFFVFIVMVMLLLIVTKFKTCYSTIRKYTILE